MTPIKFNCFILALVLLAAVSCDAIATVEDLCKDNYDTTYCVKLLKPIITSPSIFNDKTWLLHARNKVIELNGKAQDFTNKKYASNADEDAAVFCSNKLRDSYQLIQKGDFDTAAQNQLACSDSLETASGSMRDLKTLANEVALASRVVGDLYAHDK